MTEEQVLVAPTRLLHEAGHFHGLTRRVDYYLPRVLAAENLSFLPRGLAERDPTHKQIIPYVVLRWRDQVFCYQRGLGATEKRLHALHSIGVGGHINPVDQGEGDVYRRGMEREIHEEIHLESTYEDRILGLINDDTTPVGQVHLGIVHVFELAEPRVRRREAELQHSGFAPVSALWKRRHEFETWSQFVLAELLP
jgi:predicted NUDIX family phosphoesterase